MRRLGFLGSLILLLLILSCFTYAKSFDFMQRYGSNLQQQKKPSSGGSSILVSVFENLMKKNSIHNNQQFKNCLSVKQSRALDKAIKALLNLSTQLATTNTKQFPQLAFYYVTKDLSRQSLQCFFSSNDLKYLLSKYHIKDYQQMGDAFVKYAEGNNLNGLMGMLEEVNIKWKYQNLQHLTEILDKTFIQLFKTKLTSPQDDQWSINVDNPQLADYHYYGVANSNAMISVVSDKMPFQLTNSFLAGVYDRFMGQNVDNILEMIKVMDLELFINDVKFPPLNQMNYKQNIDFKKAQFSGEYSVLNQASIKYKYSALKNNPSVFFLETEVTAHEDIRIRVKNYHRIPYYFKDVQKIFQIIPLKQGFIVISTKANTNVYNTEVVLSSTFVVDLQSSKFLSGNNYGHQNLEISSHVHTLQNVHLPKGQIFRFYLISSLISSQQHSNPLVETVRTLTNVVCTNLQEVKNKHYQLWQKLWKSDIIIEGNSQDQKLIRSMVYNFYSFVGEQSSHGVPPMGLSANSYRGHVFWDMDLWMFPGLLVLQPDMAKGMIQYRYDRIKAARNNALLNGYKGAMFPWQSTKVGDQQTVYWFPGPFQIHVTGTVALAAWNYYCVTHNKDWLLNIGKQIIQGAAEFWESKVSKDEKGNYHIKNVVAPDQYAQFVDDDAFTNAIAIQNLRIANKMRKLLQLQPNKLWQQIRQKLVILQFPDTNITLQHSSYKGEWIKQADVNLLAYPLKQITQKAAILRDLEYYIKKIPERETPAMSYSIFALLYSRMGDADRAYDIFKKSYTNNLLKPFNVMAETQFGTNPYFLTGAGGILQNVIFGFAGLDITDQGIKRIQAVKPKQWQKLTIKSPFLQNLADQKITILTQQLI